MKRSILVVAFAAAVVAGQALAADLPQAPPPQAPAAYVPPVLPVYNWTARIEYLYVQLQNGSCTTAGNCGVDAAGVAAHDTVKFNTSLVRLGLDYKFR